jgi:hypothetical protein
MLSEFPAVRQVFHALCATGEDEDATELLDFAARQEWMAGLARRFESVVARFDDTMAYEPEDDGLVETLWQRQMPMTAWEPHRRRQSPARTFRSSCSGRLAAGANALSR